MNRETKLLAEDKNRLINGGLLNDKVIYVRMQLLKGAFPPVSGFQNPIGQVTNISISREALNSFNV